MQSHNCNGFIGFYSTIPNESLIAKLNNIENTIFDGKRIEQELLSNENLQKIFKSYFPTSYDKYINIESPYRPLNLFEDFFRNNEKSNNNIFFDKLFPTENLYSGFLVCNTFEELLQHLGFKVILVKFIKDYDKVIRTIFVVGYNEGIDEKGKNDRDYDAITDEKLRKTIYKIDNIKKKTDEEVRKMLQEIILDYKVPKIIKIRGFGIWARRLKGYGVYFFTSNSIYLNVFEYRHLRNLFNEIKTKYFK